MKIFNGGESLKDYYARSKMGHYKGMNNFKEFDLLYHYTSIGAIENILNNKNLWATRSDFLNDKKELTYTKELIDEVLKEQVNISDDARTIVEDITKIIGNKLKETFVLSFSTNPDSLPLWAYYSKLEGCNFGIKSKMIQGIILKSNEIRTEYTHYIGKVVYERDTQKYEILNSILFIEELINNSINVDLYYSLLIRDFANYFVFFKSHVFSSEEEFRIALTIVNPKSLDNIHHERIINGLIGKYIVVSLIDDNRKFPLDCVRLGPKYSYNLISQGVKSCLEINEFDVEVKYSELPLRFGN